MEAPFSPFYTIPERSKYANKCHDNNEACQTPEKTQKQDEQVEESSAK
jgi:hypothetical protein